MNRRAESTIRRARAVTASIADHLSPSLIFHSRLTTSLPAGTVVDYGGQLGFACPECNLHKGPNITGITQRQRRLPAFSIRLDAWEQHFRWNGPFLLGRTAIGRTTEYVIAANSPSRIESAQLRSEPASSRRPGPALNEPASYETSPLPGAGKLQPTATVIA